MTEKDLNKPERLFCNLWPETGETLGLSRGATYEGAKRGDIPVVQIGNRKLVPRAWLRKAAMVES